MCEEPGTAKAVKNSLHFPDTIIQFSNDEPLARLMQDNLKNNQYTNIRLQNKEKKVLAAKKECYPKYIAVSEKGSKVLLQNLLDQLLPE